jgi:hypothetical protein
MRIKNRRNFLKLSAIASLAILMPNNFLISEESESETKPLFPEFGSNDKIVINLLLDGGADLRHLIVPVPSEDTSTHGYWFWSSRITVFNIESSYSAFVEYFDSNYDKITLNNIELGVLKKAEWLKNKITSENVAIINNIYISENRDHAHSMLRLERGSLDATAHEYDKTGWGGRIADELNKKVVSLSRNIRVFCNAPSTAFPESHDNEIVISAYKSRELGLYESETDYMSRSLKSYYQAKALELSEESIFYKPIKHEKALREFGTKVQERLNDETGIAEPEEFSAEDFSFNSSYFKQEIKSLYDTLVCQDIFNTSMISIDYGGWDSHKNQKSQIEPKFEDMFGLNKGFDKLEQLIQRDVPTAINNTILVVSSEFGRQLSGNGDAGTDHGTGNSVFIIGEPVKGGIYGEIFPQNEIAEKKFETANTDIDGLTSFEFIIQAIAKWQGIETFDTIVSTEINSDRRIESNLNLDNLFKS